jgi:hypothetical protein
MRLTGLASLHASPARAGTARMWWSPVPHAKSENVRPVRPLTIEATIQL